METSFIVKSRTVFFFAVALLRLASQPAQITLCRYMTCNVYQAQTAFVLTAIILNGFANISTSSLRFVSTDKGKKSIHKWLLLSFFFWQVFKSNFTICLYHFNWLLKTGFVITPLSVVYRRLGLLNVWQLNMQTQGFIRHSNCGVCYELTSFVYDLWVCLNPCARHSILI